MSKSFQRILCLAASLLLLVSVWPLAVVAKTFDNYFDNYPVWTGEELDVTKQINDIDTTFNYLFIPPTDGEYTLSSSHSFRGNIHHADPTPEQDEPHEEGLDEVPIEYPSAVNTSSRCYRLKGGATYVVWINFFFLVDNDEKVTISIHSGPPVLWEDISLDFPKNGMVSINLKPGEQICYKYTPTKSNVYMLYGETSHYISNVWNPLMGMENGCVLREDASSHTPLGSMSAFPLRLKAGVTYIFKFYNSGDYPESITKSNYYLEPIRENPFLDFRSCSDPHATEFYGYIGGSDDYFVHADPVYFSGLDKCNYTIDDPTIIKFDEPPRTIKLLKAGTTMLRGVVYGYEVSKKFVVRDRPVLEVDKTTSLTFSGTRGAECLFTPPESGSYTFQIKGKTNANIYIDGTGRGTYVQGGSGSFTAKLNGGKQYTLVCDFHSSDYTIKVTKTGSTTTTNPIDEPTSTTTTSQTESTTQKPNKVPVHMENGKAMVNYDEVAHLLNGGDSLTVSIEDTETTTLSLPVQMLTEAAETNTPLRVEFSHAIVALDSTILARVAEQTEGDTIDLTVEAVPTANLTSQQQNNLKNKDVAAVMRILLNGDTDIHDLGGTAAVTIPFTPENGKDMADYAVYYLDNGKLEKMKTIVSAEGITFFTTHFSDYVLLYEQHVTAASNTKPAVKEDAKEEEFPFDVRTTVIYSLVALVIMVAGGVAIYIITKHKSNPQQRH